MAKIESRTGIIKIPDDKMFKFLTDFTNFSEFIPRDKVKNFSATPGSCSFEINGFGRIGLEIVEKIPNNMIYITSSGNTPLHFSFLVDINQQDSSTSLVKLSLEPDVNPFVMAMVKSPLQNFVDILIEQLEKLSF